MGLNDKLLTYIHLLSANRLTITCQQLYCARSDVFVCIHTISLGIGQDEADRLAPYQQVCKPPKTILTEFQVLTASRIDSTYKANWQEAHTNNC